MLFTIANTAILLAWLPLFVFPKKQFTQTLIKYPYVPFVLSFFYLYFLVMDGGLGEADFSSLEGDFGSLHQATPEAAAAGWMHYLAFDFWVGCWLLRDTQKGLASAAHCPPATLYFYAGTCRDFTLRPLSQLYLKLKS